MIIEILSFTTEAVKMFDAAMQIRFQVFSEEKKIDKDNVYDGLDFDAVHYLLLEENTPVACARWREDEQGIVIEHLAVLKDYRKKGYGFLLVKNILGEILVAKKTVYIIVSQKEVNFFQILGFVKSQVISLNNKTQKIKMIYEI